MRGTLISRRPSGLKLGSNAVIRTYQAESGMAFDRAHSRRQEIMRSRLTALAVIAVVAASAGLLQHFHDEPAPSGPAALSSGAYSAAR
jgi:hypothetical protein